MSENLENRISSEQSKDAIFKMHSVQSSASEIDKSIDLLNEYVTPEDFGADGTRVNDSIAIRAAVATGKIVKLKNKRYYYDGIAITNDFIAIEGTVMPKVNDAYTSLEGGTVIDGMFFISGSNVYLQDFGVDVGSDSDAIESDGLKCTTSIGADKTLHIENIVTLIKSEDSAKHSVLLEGYNEVYGENIKGVHGYFGFVIKCQNVTLNNIASEKTSSDGLYIKSDTSFGQAKNIFIDGVKVDGKGVQSNGIRVQADNDTVENIIIKNIDVKDCDTNILVQTLNANISNLYLSGISRNANVKSCHISAGSNIIDTIDITDFISYTTNNVGIEFQGVCKNVSLSNINIIYKDTVTDVELKKGIIVGESVLTTTFDNIRISNSDNAGYINYSNPSYLNSIGYHNCKLTAGGQPKNGYLAINLSGTTATLTPNYNDFEKQLFVKIAGLTSPTNVTSISIYKYGTTLYETGTRLTILNSGSNPLYINHNYGGKIINKNNANVLIDANTAAEWVFGGTVWHQID